MTSYGARTDRMNWDDLRFALHLAQAGSIRQAARALGVSHSTVLRRIRALEAAAGVQLFANRGDGYEVTPAGQDVFDTARALEEHVLGLERRVAGRDVQPTGEVHVTLPDPFAPVLMPVLAEISREHPGIALTVSMGTAFEDLAHRAADVAIRTTATPPPDLVGRRLLMAGVGIYGSEHYLAGHPTADLESLDWVGWEVGSTMFFARWMAEQVPRARIALRVSPAWGLREAVDAGVGVAILPCALGEGRPGWRRVAFVPAGAAPLWILTHRDLRRTARVRVVRTALAEWITAQREVFEGVA